MGGSGGGRVLSSQMMDGVEVCAGSGCDNAHTCSHSHTQKCTYRPMFL